MSLQGVGTVRILMKSMMAGALVSLAAVVASGSANAAACQTTTLSVWLSIANFSCTVGDKSFSNFSYSPDGFTAVPATVVGVGPDNLFGLPGLAFNAFWQNTNAPGGANFDALLSFDVTSLGAPINDFHFALDGVVGPVLDVATLTFPNGTGVSLSSSNNNSQTITFAPVMSLHVQDDIGVNPGGTISSVHKSFSQVPGPIVGAGLPGLVAACGGLLALARRRRRQCA
jgi:hypothetical protein